MAAGLNGKLATHSLRKSFAQRVYEQSNDIYLVQELLGHKNVETTQKYLGVNYADARAAVEGMALASEPYRTVIRLSSPSLQAGFQTPSTKKGLRMIQNGQQLKATLDRIDRFIKQIKHIEGNETNVANMELSSAGFRAEINRMNAEVAQYL